jgi:hypothetical protein
LGTYRSGPSGLSPACPESLWADTEDRVNKKTPLGNDNGGQGKKSLHGISSSSSNHSLSLGLFGGGYLYKRQDTGPVPHRFQEQPGYKISSVPPMGSSMPSPLRHPLFGIIAQQVNFIARRFRQPF